MFAWGSGKAPLAQVWCPSAPCWRVSCPAHRTLLLSSPPGFPESVELAPLPQWQPVGENFTLHCKVKGGEPRNSLSVLLLRGKEVLDRQPVEGHPAEVTTTVLARREDHGANFSCHTELDLRTQSLGLIQNSSATRQLRTFGEALGSLQEDRFRWYSCLGWGVPGKEGAPGSKGTEKVVT